METCVKEHTRYKILVIDDEEIVRNTASKILRGSYEIKTASNGEEGLVETSRFCPDLILLDYVMPGMGALDFMDERKQQPSAMKIPVVIMTSDYVPEIELASLKAGAADFIRKPLSKELLHIRLRRIFSHLEFYRLGI